MGEGPATVRVRGKKSRYYAAIAAATVLGAGVAVGTTVGGANAAPNTAGSVAVPKTSPASTWAITPRAATPIKHLVVLFDENVSFDHYFGTYPFAANTDGTKFQARRGTPTVNGLYTKITSSGPVGPAADQQPELLQPQPAHPLPGADLRPEPRLHRGAEGRRQREDGPVHPEHRDRYVHRPAGLVRRARPGHGLLRRRHGHRAVELRAELRDERQQLGHHVRPVHAGCAQPDLRPDRQRLRGRPEDRGQGRGPGRRQPAERRRPGHGLRRPRPAFDDCSDNNHTSSGSSHANIGGNSSVDYSPHHNPFEYYKSTANPEHLPPSSEAAIGHADQANHHYDLSDFYTTLKDGNMPAVSFLKAAEYQDGHPGYSDPLDEQTFLVNTINQIEKSKFWSSTAIVVAYDDSDGWYDHQKPVIVNGSNTSLDAAIWSSSPVRLAGIPVRCGYSQRLPLLVISPWSRANHVSHQLTDTASIIKFAENNWLGGKRIGGGSFDAIAGSLSGMLQFFAPHIDPVILDPTTGAVVRN